MILSLIIRFWRLPLHFPSVLSPSLCLTYFARRLGFVSIETYLNLRPP